MQKEYPNEKTKVFQVTTIVQKKGYVRFSLLKEKIIDGENASPTCCRQLLMQEKLDLDRLVNQHGQN